MLINVSAYKLYWLVLIIGGVVAASQLTENTDMFHV